MRTHFEEDADAVLVGLLDEAGEIKSRKGLLYN